MYKNTDWLTQTEQTSFFSKTCFRISILACIWIAVQHVPFVTRPLNNPNFNRLLRIILVAFPNKDRIIPVIDFHTE